jgi:hypothetical protein
MLKITQEKEEESKGEEPKAEEEPQAKPALDFGQISAHFANERTFLTWAWTGMLLMGFGVAIAKLRIALLTSLIPQARPRNPAEHSKSAPSSWDWRLLSSDL